MMTNVNKSIGLNRSQQGATMIEIMIAILVFSVGLLGLASTQTLGLTNTQSALSRSYAAQLSYELVDIMRLNRTVTSGAGGAVNIFDGLTPRTRQLLFTLKRLIVGRTLAVQLLKWLRIRLRFGLNACRPYYQTAKRHSR